jgi:hypothetical protein
MSPASSDRVGRGAKGRPIVVSAVCVLAFVTLICPLVWNRVPPLLDYAGHLARVQIIYQLLHGIGFADMYKLQISIVPNLAIDTVGVALMELGVPVEAAGHGFLVLTFSLLGAGVLALHRVNFARAAIWPCIAIPFLVQEGSLWGFMNYLFSLGLGLCSVALWRHTRQEQPIIGGILLVAGSFLVFFSHLAGFLIVSGVVVASEIGELLCSLAAWPGSSRRRPNSVSHLRPVRTALIGICTCLLPLILLILAPMMAEHNPPSASFVQQFQVAMLKERVRHLLGFAWAYDDRLDAASAACFVGLLIVGGATKCLRICWPMVLPISGLLAIYLVIPDGWYGTQALPERLPIALFLLTVSAVDFETRRNWQFWLVTSAVVVLAFARSLTVDRVWQIDNRRLEPLLATLQSLPEGSRVYSALAYEGDFIFSPAVIYYGAPAYLVMYRNAFYPHAFTVPGQNLVVPQPALAAAPRMPRNFRVDKLHPPGTIDDPYSADRLAFYDYILIVDPRGWPYRPPSGLKLVSTGAEYQLMQIDKTQYPRQ